MLREILEELNEAKTARVIRADWKDYNGNDKWFVFYIKGKLKIGDDISKSFKFNSRFTVNSLLSPLKQDKDLSTKLSYELIYSIVEDLVDETPDLNFENKQDQLAYESRLRNSFISLSKKLKFSIPYNDVKIKPLFNHDTIPIWNSLISVIKEINS